MHCEPVKHTFRQLFSVDANPSKALRDACKHMSPPGKSLMEDLFVVICQVLPLIRSSVHLVISFVATSATVALKCPLLSVFLAVNQFTSQ